MLDVGLEADGMVADELRVEYGAGPEVLGGKHLLHDALKNGDVAVDAHGQKQVGELRAASGQHLQQLLRVLKAHQAHLR